MQEDFDEQIKLERLLFEFTGCVSELVNLKSVMSRQDMDYLQLINQQVDRLLTGGNYGIA